MNKVKLVAGIIHDVSVVLFVAFLLIVLIHVYTQGNKPAPQPTHGTVFNLTPVGTK